MRSWLSVLITDAESKKVFDIPIAPSLYSLSNKMDNSLLVVRDINHKYIVVERIKMSCEEHKVFGPIENLFDFLKNRKYNDYKRVASKRKSSLPAARFLLLKIIVS